MRALLRRGGMLARAAAWSTLARYRAALCAAVLAAATVPAPAQTWRVVPSVVAQVTATDNAAFTAPAAARKDVLVDVFPQIAVHGHGPHLQVEGSIGANAVHYVNGTETNRVLPRGKLGAQSVLVERLLYLDASVEGTRSVSDPFLGRPEGASTYNLLSAVRTEVTPRLLYAPTPYTQFEAQSRTTIVKTNGQIAAEDPRRYTRTQEDLLRFERKPTPVGLQLEATDDTSKYRAQDVVPLAVASVRATLTAAPHPELELGVRAGRDRARFALNDFTDDLTGVTAHWRPTDRTRLDAEVEKRFFGTGGEITFQHRSPFLSVMAQLQRKPTTTAASLGALPAGADLAGVLDDILATRYTNPVERASEVQALIASRGLTSVLTQPLEVFSESAQLQDSATLTLGVLGARHFGSLTVFSAKSTALVREGQNALVLSLRDSKQDGGSLQLGRRLSPQSSANVFINGTRILGLGLQQGQASVSKSLRLSLDQQLRKGSTATVGLRRQLINSTSADNARESSAFAAVAYNF